MDDGEYEFFYPVLTGADHCGGCKACRQACPVHAINIEVTGATVDREACLKVNKKQGGECFECLLACRYNVLTMKKFRKGKEGTILRVD